MRLVLAIALLASAQVRAATITAASNARADVLNAYNATSNGDTLDVPAGTNTWATPITIAKLITVQGSGTNSCRIRNSSAGPSGGWLPIFNINLATDGVVRITGFWFEDTSSSDLENADSLGIQMPGGGVFERQVRIDNCVFKNFRWGIYNNGAWGVAHNCYFLDNRVGFRVQGFNVAGDLPVSGAPYGWDSTNNFVLEDCIFERQAWTFDIYEGDTEWPAQYVVRNCVFNLDRAANIGLDGFDMHGEVQSGRINIGIQVYSNYFNYTGSSTVNPSRFADIRGGVGSLIYSNVVVGPGTMQTTIDVRDDPTAGVLTTNNWIWANTDDSGGFAVSGGDGCAINVNWFETGAPPGFAQIPYPHPLRGSAPADSTPPTPDPATFAVNPTALSASSITMTATTATDATTPPVAYYFDETSGNAGGTDSGWQASPIYVDAGLSPSTQYTYKVKTRDSASTPNETAFSSSENATTPAAGPAVLIPDGRRVTWQGNVGVPGGIPTYPVGKTATDSPYNADPTGVTDATTAINSALAATSASNACFLPAGTYRINGTITVPTRVVLRGAGPGTSGGTLLNMGDAGKFELLSGGLQALGRNITAGLSKGSTTLTVDSVSGLAVGDIVALDETNNTSFVTIGDCDYCSRTNGTRLLQFISEVTGISGSDVTIDPPMPFTLTSGHDPELVDLNTGTLMQWAGVEDLRIQHTNEGATSDGYTFEIRHAKHCWLKNVAIDRVPEYGVFAVRVFGCEFRHCDFRYGASDDYDSGKAYGMGIWWGSSWNLFEDNIAYFLRHSFTVEGGGAGNVWAYNYSDRMFDAFYPDTDYLMGDLLLHGAHPVMNLYEGNVARVLYFDNVHGSGSDNTAFRNWLVGESRGEEIGLTNYLYMDWGLTAVGIDENHLSNNIVGNVLGATNLHPVGLVNAYDAETISGANPATTWYAYILGQVDRANLGTAPGWAEVTNGLLRHLNWDPVTATNSGVRFDLSGMADELTLPDSLYLTNKPSYFGILTWPPFNPYTSSLADLQDIPAGYRFVHGVDPPLSVLGGVTNLQILGATTISGRVTITP